MPNLSKYKDKSNWMSDCLKVNKGEGKKIDQSIAICLSQWKSKRQHKEKKMAHRVACRWAEASDTVNDIPQGLKNIILTVGKKMKRAFQFEMPQDVEWRTYNHPEYEIDKKQNTKADDGGFITKDFKKVYVNLDSFKNESYEDFVAHEMGHFLDKHLGGGSYFSHQFSGVSKEVFAMMVNYVITEGCPGGEKQTMLYNAACDKLGIPEKGRVKASGSPSIRPVLNNYINENPRVIQRTF